MPNQSTSGPRVCLLAYDGLCTFEFGVAFEAFGLARPELGQGWYQCQTVALEPGPLSAAGGLSVAAPYDLAALDHSSLVIVPGWRGADAAVPAAAVRAIINSHQKGARSASLCPGVFVLAATGLLDGKRATTHWRYADALARKYPAIKVEPDVFYVDNGSTLTAAGSAAGIDLCLHIIRQDFGHEAANSVARRMVVAPHRDGGQAQFIKKPVPVPHEGDRLGRLMDHLAHNLGSEMSLAEMADMAGMSLRTFQRRFQDLTGQPPGQWLVQARVAEACRLLEQGHMTNLEQVASAVGFGSSVTLRHHFRFLMKLSPRAYRMRFAKEAVSPT